MRAACVDRVFPSSGEQAVQQSCESDQAVAGGPLVSERDLCGDVVLEDACLGAEQRAEHRVGRERRGESGRCRSDSAGLRSGLIDVRGEGLGDLRQELAGGMGEEVEQDGLA